MGGSQSLRHLGMIATSGSWRRFWLEWRLKSYRQDSPGNRSGASS